MQHTVQDMNMSVPNEQSDQPTYNGNKLFVGDIESGGEHRSQLFPILCSDTEYIERPQLSFKSEKSTPEPSAIKYETNYTFVREWEEAGAVPFLVSLRDHCK